jgi:hypothetical protein
MVLIGIIFYFTITPEKAKTYEVNNPDLNKKLLIATEGGDFKETLVTNITDKFKEKSVYIKVTDVSELPETNKDNWNAIVIITGVRFGKMGNGVDGFLSGIDNYDNIILFNTGNMGTFEPNYDIDAISSASTNTDFDKLSEKVLNKISGLL